MIPLKRSLKIIRQFKYKGANVTIQFASLDPNVQAYKDFLQLKKDTQKVVELGRKYEFYGVPSTFKSLITDGKFSLKGNYYNVMVEMGGRNTTAIVHDSSYVNSHIISLRKNLIVKLRQTKLRHSEMSTIMIRAHNLSHSFPRRFDRFINIETPLEVYGSYRNGFVHAEPNQIIKIQNIRRSSMMYKPVKPKTQERHVGIEIECGTKISMEDLGLKLLDLAGYVMIKRDGSVNVQDRHNVELNICAPVSQYKTILKRVTDVLNSPEVSARVNKTCGLHVHLDIREAKSEFSGVISLTKVSDYFAKLVTIQPILYSMQPKSRQNNNYCLKTKTRAIKRGGSRYHGINSQAIWKYNTIEVRLHAGTTEYAKIANWIDLLSSVMYSQVTTPKRAMSSVRSFFRTFQEVPSSLMEYVVERTRKFADVNAEESEMAEAI